MQFKTRSLSAHESRVVLTLAEQKRRNTTREEILKLLPGSTPQGADHVIRSLQTKGWLERAGRGRYLLIPPDQGPDALGDSNLLALASRLADPSYIGFSTAAAHYGLTTQHRHIVWLVTPRHIRPQKIQGTEVRIVNLGPRRFFGFGEVNVLGYPLNMSDREKTMLDCVDRTDLAGGIGEAAQIFATGARRCDWEKLAGYVARINTASLARRVGYLAEHTGAAIPEGIHKQFLKMADRPGVSFFGPRKAPENAVGYVSNWRLTVNAPEADLSESAGMAKTRVLRKDR